MSIGRRRLSLAAALALELCAARTAVADDLPAAGGETTITGSRIRRKDVTTAAPVTVITRDQVLASGKASIGEFLQTLPEQGNAINTSFDNGGDGSTRIALRSLGVQRTLVLLNGRRMVPGGSGADSTVDLNSIPTAVVERVEVLKDGASSVYGSDAIAGVVNVITRRKFDATEVSGYTGTSSRGGGTLYEVNATSGTSGERGSIMFSAGFASQRPIFASDRPFSAAPTAFDATGQNNPYGNPAGPFTYGYDALPAGVVTLPSNAAGSPLYDQLNKAYPGATQFVRDSSSPLGWRPFNAWALPNGSPSGDAYNWLTPFYLTTPQQRISLFSAGEVKLHERARGYFEASYVNRQSSQQLNPQPLPGLTVSAGNQYNPFGVDVSASRILDEFGNRRFTQDIDALRVVGGIDGTLPDSAGPLKGFFWDLSLNYGRTMGTQLTTGNIRTTQLWNALGPSANGQCLDAHQQPIAGCVPLDLFGGAGSITPDQVNAFAFTGAQRGTNQLLSLQANTSGELFKLYADRPVAIAVGYEYRNLQGSQIPDPVTAAGETSGNTIKPTSGGYYVNEGFAELSVPIVSGLPLAHSLEGSASARAFHYSTFGGDWTYKLGGRWSPLADVAFRGTYSTAFRAPSIADLYLGHQDNYPGVADPCADAGTAPASCGAAAGNGGNAQNLKSTIGGNPGLRPETATIRTLGVVLEPRWVKNLTVTVDYYGIDVEDAITTVGEATILNACYPASGNPDPAACALIARDATTQQITNIMNLNANAGKEAVSGIDVALRYRLPTRRYGRFGFSFDGTWLKNHDLTLANGTVISGRGNYDLNGTNGNYQGFGGVNPAWKFNAGVAWALKGFGANVQTRFIGSFKECGDSSGFFGPGGACYVDSTYQRKVDAWSMWDASVGYTLATSAGRTNFVVGVNNLFNALPATIYSGFVGATDPTAYDFVGRFFYGRVSHTL